MTSTQPLRASTNSSLDGQDQGRARILDSACEVAPAWYPMPIHASHPQAPTVTPASLICQVDGFKRTVRLDSTIPQSAILKRPQANISITWKG